MSRSTSPPGGAKRSTWPTADKHIVDGARFASKHRLQLWHAIIWQVAASARVALRLSDDMQDGLKIAGTKVLNPFAAANGKELTEVLSAAP